jgi:hypothetical protein
MHAVINRVLSPRIDEEFALHSPLISFLSIVIGCAAKLDSRLVGLAPEPRQAVKNQVNGGLNRYGQTVWGKSGGKLQRERGKEALKATDRAGPGIADSSFSASRHGHVGAFLNTRWFNYYH